MIRAVVYRAEWEHSVNDFRITHPDEPLDPPPQFPAELVEWFDFQRYGLPPNAGGMRDQPLGWMARCKQLSEAYRVWRMWMACDKGPEWVDAHRDEWKTARQLRSIVYG